MPTARNYTTPANIASLTGIDVSLITDRLINQAEMMIDQYTADFYIGGNEKANLNKLTYTATATSTTVLLAGVTGISNDYFKFTTVRFTTGTICPVLSSIGNLLTIPTTAGLPASSVVEIMQMGKFPRAVDKFSTNKYIMPEIQDAVGYQVAFLIEKSKPVNGVKTGVNLGYGSAVKQSESIGENYSYSLRSGENSIAGGKYDTVSERLSPLARDIIDQVGLSYQSVC